MGCSGKKQTVGLRGGLNHPTTYDHFHLLIVSKVKVKERLDRNLLSAKFFHKMLYHQTTTKQIKISELKNEHCSIRKSFGIKNVLQKTAMVQE